MESTSQVPQSEGTIIEGIGDELLHAFIIFIILIMPLIIAYFAGSSSSAGTIHPENEHRVFAARQRIADRDQQSNDDNASTSDASSTSRGRFNTDHCPICLGEMFYATETNCGHVFCGNCLVMYWRHGNWLGSINCPVCRQQVTLLLPCFREVDHTTAESLAVMSEINDYNRRFSGAPRPMMDYLRDLPTLLRYTMAEFFSLNGLIWMFRIKIIFLFVAAIVYLVSPLDIIPEAVFGLLGFLDDIFVIVLILIYVTIIYRGYIANRITRA